MAMIWGCSFAKQQPEPPVPYDGNSPNMHFLQIRPIVWYSYMLGVRSRDGNKGRASLYGLFALAVDDRIG